MEKKGCVHISSLISLFHMAYGILLNDLFSCNSMRTKGTRGMPYLYFKFSRININMAAKLISILIKTPAQFNAGS